MKNIEIVIRPPRGWASLGLDELKGHGDLFRLLSWRNVAVQYKQTFFGVAWALVQPLFTSGIFTLFFGRFAGMPSDGRPYFLFSFSGMLLWTFFRNTVTSASQSLVSNVQLVTKVYFPRLIIPASTVAVSMLDLLVALCALAVLLPLQGFVPGPSVLLAPLVIAGTTTAALGIGLLLAAVNVRFRDVRFTIPFIMQCWMFATPVIFPSSVVPERYRLVFALNPMAGFIETFRAILLSLPVPWGMLAVSSAVTVAVFILGAIVFRRMERYFADMI